MLPSLRIAATSPARGVPLRRCRSLGKVLLAVFVLMAVAALVGLALLRFRGYELRAVWAAIRDDDAELEAELHAAESIIASRLARHRLRGADDGDLEAEMVAMLQVPPMSPSNASALPQCAQLVDEAGRAAEQYRKQIAKQWQHTMAQSRQRRDALR